METRDLIKYTSILEDLSADTLPLWGIMTPQHMVEHLSASIRMSNGKLYLTQSIPDEDIPKRIAFLFSDLPFPKGIRQQNSTAELRPLHCVNLEEARSLLHNMLLKFDSHFTEKPYDKPIHPLFGPLDKHQWIRFHYRHMQHHFTQFGLITSKPKSS